MAHINTTRNVNTISSTTIRQLISENTHFAVFAGSPAQRDAIALHQMALSYGKKGIVLIHNNPNLERQLGTMSHLTQQFENTTMLVPNRCRAQKQEYAYDPLYGLTQEYVLDAILPSPQKDSPLALQIAKVRAALSCYLQILSYHFQKSTHGFGSYPFNLDLLLDITAMSMTELQESVLQYLPQSLHDSAYAVLSKEDMPSQVYAQVYSFSQSMSQCLWNRRSGAEHPGISIVQAVQNRQFLSIYVPANHSEVLEYLSLECRLLNDRGLPYLLVVDNLNINQSPGMKRLFLNEHTASSYTTGFIASDLSSILSCDDNELTTLFSQTNDIFVLQCPSTQTARPFCENAGSYYRYAQSYNHGRDRRPFHLFSAHSYGSTVSPLMEASIRPQELTQSRDVCLLCGKDHPIPTLIQHLQIPNTVPLRR